MPYRNRLSLRSIISLCLSTFFLALWSGSTAFANKGAPEAGIKVPVLSYYMSPPFLTGDNQGLTYDFVALMNKAADGKFVFELENLPKRRAEMALEKADTALLLFVNPAFIESPSRFSWSGGILSDRSGVLSSAKMRIEYDEIEKLHGLVMGGVYDRRYGELDVAVKLKKIRREDAALVRQNILKLAMGRIDFTVAPESVLRNLVCELGLEDHVFFSSLPYSEYTRHIMIKADAGPLHTFIANFVHSLADNKQWQDIVTQYYMMRDGAMGRNHIDCNMEKCALLEEAKAPQL